MQGRRSGRRPHATAGARCALAAFCLLCSAAGAGTYAEEAPAVAEPPAHHHRYAVPSTVRSLASYSVPDLAMIRDDGQAVSLREELDDGAPVVLDFIYTTCTTVCSMSSRTFARLQQLLGTGHAPIHLASISIDPEQDTPEHLTGYAQKFGAGPQWRQYTGSLQASLAAQQAFGVYRGDKMSHNPVTLVRTAPGRDWVRFDGFATAGELLQELRTRTAAR
jgi:protein SCO1/2